MMLSKPRGAFSADAFEAIRSDPSRLVESDLPEPESQDDSAVALWAFYELHYRRFQDVDKRLEWDPSVVQLRGELEAGLEARPRER